MDHVTSEPCYKGTILLRNSRNSYNSSVKFHGKKNLGATTWPCYIQICVTMRREIKGMHCSSNMTYLPGSPFFSPILSSMGTSAEKCAASYVSSKGDL